MKPIRTTSLILIILSFVSEKPFLAQNYNNDIFSNIMKALFGAPVREVTNWNQINSRNGLPVQYWYSETGTGIISAPGCPKSIEGHPWIYYGNPARCFLAFFNGPCPRGQKLIYQRGSNYGICACDCFDGLEESEILRKSRGRYVFCEDVLFGTIYDRKNRKCYRLLDENEKGPCPNGTVIAKYTGTSLTCLPNCDYVKTGWEADWKNGLCTSVPSVAYGPYYPLFDWIDPNDRCSTQERYSKILNKCVRKTQARVG